jgi:hypothetical protein
MGLSLRVSREARQRLDEAVAASGRSISAEAELRLEMALREERTLGDTLELAFGRQGAAVLEIIGHVMRQEGDWLDEPERFDRVYNKIKTILGAVAPTDYFPEEDAAARNQVVILLHHLFGPELPGPAWIRQAVRLRERLGPAASQRAMLFTGEMKARLTDRGEWP